MSWQHLHQVKQEVRKSAQVRVLFVCLGNICRSPTAEGVFRHLLNASGLADKIYVDSAGTHAYMAGSAPDPRSQATALRRGIDLSDLSARRITEADFIEFDYVLAMDRENMGDLLDECENPALRNRVRLFLDFAPHLSEREVPDPYYGGAGGFDRVIDMIEAASQGLLSHLREQYQL